MRVIPKPAAQPVLAVLMWMPILDFTGMHAKWDRAAVIVKEALPNVTCKGRFAGYFLNTRVIPVCESNSSKSATSKIAEIGWVRKSSRN